MSDIKVGINTTMPVRFTFQNGMSVVNVERVEFIFKQDRNEGSPILKSALYDPTDPEADVALSDDVFQVRWTREETYAFMENQTFYMDTRVKFYDSIDNPPTPIVGMRMGPSLFEEGD